MMADVDPTAILARAEEWKDDRYLWEWPAPQTHDKTANLLEDLCRECNRMHWRVSKRKARAKQQKTP